MSYSELLDTLYSARTAGVKLGLDRVRRCLSALGDPHHSVRARVHIGGTNGKGSTVAFVDSMLREGGLRTGVFTSPHLLRFQERFVVAGVPLSEDQVLAAGVAVHAAMDGDNPLTFFERTTVMALWAFREAGVEVAVLEVGLGGRLDATNVVDAEVAAVTGVALDHQSYLGDTIATIAQEKAGIFKPGQMAIVGAAGVSEAVSLLCAAAERAGVATLRVIDDRALAAAEVLPRGLLGAHQTANAACALAVIDHLEARGLVSISTAQRAAGLATARLAGRMEVLAVDPIVIVDGAHNPHAAETLARSLGALPRRSLTVVIGVSADKDIDGIVAPLVTAADVVIATRSQMLRAAPVERVAAAVARARPDLPVIAVESVPAAIAVARRHRSAADLVLVTGSLFIVAEARAAVLGLTRETRDLSDPMGSAPVWLGRPSV